jgi:CBS domain-containing protein
MSKLFENLTVRDVFTPLQSMEFAFVSDSIESVVEKMHKHKISALPVYDLKQGRFCGLIDAVDISHHLSNHKKAGDFFESTRVGQVYNSNIKSYFVGITVDTPLDTAISLMVEQHLYRLPVIDANDRKQLVGLLSQSAIVRWLGPRLGEAAKLSPVIGSNPISLPLTATIKEAITVLHSQRVMGLPVVQEGRVVGDFNLTDLELLGPSQAVLHIASPLSWFLAKFRENTAPYDLTVPDTAQLGDIVAALNSNKLHRVYICHPKTHALERVVSLTDILEYLYIWDPETTRD